MAEGRRAVDADEGLRHQTARSSGDRGAEQIGRRGHSQGIGEPQLPRAERAARRRRGQQMHHDLRLRVGHGITKHVRNERIAHDHPDAERLQTRASVLRPGQSDYLMPTFT